MRTFNHLVAIALMALITIPPSVFVDDSRAAPQATVLSDGELAQITGGVFGGRIGQENGGILEMSCGAEDLWNKARPPVWSNGTPRVVHYAGCPGSSGKPHFLPRYNSPTNVQVAVGGVITQADNNFSYPPQINVYVNGSNVPFATVGCSPRFDYDKGIGYVAPTNSGGGNQLVEAWACPGNLNSQTEFEEIDLGAAGLLQGLNSVRAVTVQGNAVNPQFDDQEIRFFCVGTGTCLPARVELRPNANGTLNQFEFQSPSAIPRWQTVSDYPDPVDSTQLGSDCLGPTSSFVGHTTTSVKTQLFGLGGTIPSGLTFSSCTLKSHIEGGGGQCGVTHYQTKFVVRSASGVNNVGPALNMHGMDRLEYTRVMTTNPFTGTSWKSADLTGIEAGIVDGDPAAPGISIADLIMECAI